MASSYAELTRRLTILKDELAQLHLGPRQRGAMAYEYVVLHPKAKQASQAEDLLAIR